MIKSGETIRLWLAVASTHHVKNPIEQLPMLLVTGNTNPILVINHWDCLEPLKIDILCAYMRFFCGPVVDHPSLGKRLISFR
jgi:hypothetical protein